MSGRIGAMHFDPNSDQVWTILSSVGAVGRYSEAARALVMSWVRNAWLYDTEGCPGELDTQILLQVEHLRLDEGNRGPCVHPFVNCLDGLMYGVHLTTYEAGLEVRVTGTNDMPGPVLTMVFSPSYDRRRVEAFARAFGIPLPDLTKPVPPMFSCVSDSSDPSIGRVDMNVVDDGGS